MKQNNFAKLKCSLPIPDLLELDKNSYREFLQLDVEPEKRKYQGLQAAFLDVFGDYKKGDGVISTDGSLILQFKSYAFDEQKYDLEETRVRDYSFVLPLKATFILLQKLENGKIKELSEQEVYLCELPIMTDTGSFLINGAERVVVTQIHRSPGVIFVEDEEKPVSQLGKKLYKASIIPYRGSWIDFEFDINNVLYVHIDKKRKITATTLLRAVGIDTTEDIIKLFCCSSVLVPAVHKICRTGSHSVAIYCGRLILL